MRIKWLRVRWWLKMDERSTTAAAIQPQASAGASSRRGAMHHASLAIIPGTCIL
jgi:hypothetical protein